MDWALARRVYDDAHKLLQFGAANEVAATKLAELESSTDQLVDSMQPQLREMLMEKLGAKED